jgi:hypothetical protein
MGKKQKKNSRRAGNGSVDIARAEKRLAKTLRKLDDVREELATREAHLRTLLVRHGRLPETEPETTPLLDQRQVVSAASFDIAGNGFTHEPDAPSPEHDQHVASHGDEQQWHGDGSSE